MGSYTKYDAADPDGTWVRNFNRVQNALRLGDPEEQVVAELEAAGWPASEARRIVNAQGVSAGLPVQSEPEPRKSRGRRSGSSRSHKKHHRRAPADQSWGCVVTVGVLWLIGGACMVIAYFTLAGKMNTAAHGNWEGIRVLMGIMGCAYAIVAIGLLKMKPWARVPALLLGGLMCFNIPIGTVIGIMFLMAMSKNERNFRPHHR